MSQIIREIHDIRDQLRSSGGTGVAFGKVDYVGTIVDTSWLDLMHKVPSTGFVGPLSTRAAAEAVAPVARAPPVATVSSSANPEYIRNGDHLITCQDCQGNAIGAQAF